MKKPVLFILFVTLLIDMIGFGMIIPILPTILTNPESPSFLLHGFTQSQQFLFAGMLTALFGLMQFIAAPILGELSDIYGRKKLLTFGVIILAVAQLLFGYAILIASLPLLVFSRMIAGIAGANFSIAQASIADVTAPADRAKNFGLIGAAFGIGFILGPLLGGFISHTLFQSAAAPFFVAGALGIVNACIVLFLLPETHTTKSTHIYKFTVLQGMRNIITAFKDVDARPLFLGNFLFSAGFTFFTSFIGILLVQRFAFSEAAIGGFFGVVGVWIVITQVVILRALAKRYTERSILRASFFILATGIFLYPFVHNSLLAYALIPLIAIGNGLSIANMSALISKGVSPSKQGAALGINGSLLALSAGLAPLIAGFAGGTLSVEAPFFAGAFLVLCAWYVVIIGGRKPSVQ